jgi:lysophospholipid acyltransferase (LPLAT)-like uncharacterized protein
MENVHPFDLYTKNPEQSYIFGHWHGDELALIAIGKHSKFLTLSSQSKDGTIMAAALKVMGFEVIRGSSTRGGTRSLIALLRKMKEDYYYVSFSLDGPKGPRHESKPGVHLFACKSGLNLFQCLVSCDRKWEIRNTWNKCYLPKPFAKIKIHLYTLPKATKDNREEILNILNSRTMISSTI